MINIQTHREGIEKLEDGEVYIAEHEGTPLAHIKRKEDMYYLSEILSFKGALSPAFSCGRDGITNILNEIKTWD